MFVGRTNDDLCPVAGILAYFTGRGCTPGPLFTDEQYRPLMKVRFVARIRGLLETAGYPAVQFSGHSFRIGAAMAAAQEGLEDSSIQTLGRWSSAAFLIYIRTPAAELAATAARIAATGRGRQPADRRAN